MRVAIRYFTESLIRKEKIAENPRIKSVATIGTAGKFGIPTVTITVPAVKLSAIDHKRTLLGTESQK